MHRLTLHAVLTAALAAGCAGTVGYSGGVSGAAYGPDLVYVAPGVQVIADYDEPIFYSDSFYWRWDGRYWYRSSSYTGGWVVYSSPPRAIVRIERPHQYVHYRPQGWTPRGQRVQQGPIVRDHRDERRIEQPRREAPPPRREGPPRQGREAPPPRREAPPPQRREAPPPQRREAPPQREQRGHDKRDKHDHRK